MNKDWKAKLESAYSFMLKYSKITVWMKMRHFIAERIVRKEIYVSFIALSQGSTLS